MSRKRAKLVLPPGVKPWACVTLCVDPGESCGVAIYDQGVYYDSGCGDGFDAKFHERWIAEALFVGRRWGVPVVLVMEQPPAGGKPFKVGGRVRSIAGTGSVIGCRKLWQRSWSKYEGTVTRYVVHVYPPTWRAPVLGTLINPAPREAMRASMEKYGNATAGRARGQPPDECAAICIGIWASNARQVLAVLPKRLQLKCVS